jgi:hypothetical protein
MKCLQRGTDWIFKQSSLRIVCKGLKGSWVVPATLQIIGFLILQCFQGLTYVCEEVAADVGAGYKHWTSRIKTNYTDAFKPPEKSVT